MKITKRQLRQMIREALEVHLVPEDLEDMTPEEAYGLGYYAKEATRENISEAMNPAMAEIENELRHTLAEYIDTYMMSMNMNPGDPADRRRLYHRIESITSAIIGN